MLIKSDCPLLGFSAYSGTGKTTLLSQVLPILKEQGLRIAVIKHAHHTFDIDQPGKDSHTLRHAGASQMLIASSKRWALMVETPEQTEPPALQEMIAQLDQSQLDIILVEGFKDEAIPKIELHRPSLAKPFLYSHDNNIIALATDEKIKTERNITLLDINNIEQIAEFIIQYIQIYILDEEKLNTK